MKAKAKCSLQLQQLELESALTTINIFWFQG
jgi:hypothetical protein